MGIGYESLQVFGVDVYNPEKRNGQFIEIPTLEDKIEEVYGVILGEERYEELLESGVDAEKINAEDYASKYGDNVFHNYSVLMLIKYGNYVIDKCSIFVGFKVDLNQENFEEIERKKETFLEELKDFKAKTDLHFSQPKYDSIMYVI